MIRIHPLLAVIFTVAACILSGPAFSAELGIDVEYAETQRLSTESILLDVTRIGDRLVAVGERGHVVYSDDGTSWRQAEHVPTRSTLTTIFSLGNRLWAAGHDAVIITSKDRGQTWSLENFDSERMQAVMDLRFMDEQRGVAIGSYGLILETDDGGQNWIDSVVDGENDYHLNSLIRFSDGRQIIAGEAGYSYRSYDDGETWEMLDLPYLGSMWGVIALPDECLVFYGLRGHAMESCDFGTTWNEIETGTQSSLSGAAEMDGMLVLAGNSGVVLTREDGVFSQHIHSSGVDFAAVLALDDGHFLLVGEEGVHHFPEPVAEESRP